MDLNEAVRVALCAQESKVELCVLFTDVVETRAALTAAARLVRGLNLPLTLILARVVPFPLPLDEPDIPAEFLEPDISDMVSVVDTDITVRVLLCRDRNEAFARAAATDSLLIAGAGRIWSRFRYRNLFRSLRAGGHSLVLIDT